MSTDSILNTRILIAILIYCIFAGILIFARPYPLYDEEKRQFRRFGVGPGETLFSLGAILSLGAVLAFICVTILWPIGASPESVKIEEEVVAAAATAPQQQGGGSPGDAMPMYKGHNPFFGYGHFDHQYTSNGSGITFPPSRIWKSY